MREIERVRKIVREKIERLRKIVRDRDRKSEKDS